MGKIKIPFRRTAVTYYWETISRTEWKLNPDPIESARKWIVERGGSHQVQLLDVQAAPGTRVVAFQVTDFMGEWAKNTRELAMDSTCELISDLAILRIKHNTFLVGTNNSNCELFAAVAGAYGSGIPLAYCFVQTSKEAGRGAKKAILKSFLGELRKLGVMPEYTLSDKDWSEIEAMMETWPEAKHQLCFWHALRALKQRLSKRTETPAHYDPTEVQREFSFVTSIFVPLAQQGLLNQVCIVS